MVGVTDAEGRLVGLLTVENLGEMMMVRSLRVRATSVQGPNALACDNTSSCGTAPDTDSGRIAQSIAWTAAHAADIEGRAKPVDGDSFDIEIRIFGIDTPETGQTCKDAAKRDYPCGRIANDAMAASSTTKRLFARRGIRTQSMGGQWRYAMPVVSMSVRRWSSGA